MRSEYFKAYFSPLLPPVSYCIILPRPMPCFVATSALLTNYKCISDDLNYHLNPVFQAGAVKHSPLCCSVPWYRCADPFSGMVDSRDRSWQREIIISDRDLNQPLQIVPLWQLFLPGFFLEGLHMKTDLIQGTTFTAAWLSWSLVEPHPSPACCWAHKIYFKIPGFSQFCHFSAS